MRDDAYLPTTLEERRHSAMPLQWNGPFMPKDGDRVRVTYGDLGPGRVIGYFAARGELGVAVRLAQPAEPWTRQAAGRLVHVYGAEIESEDSP